MSAVIRTKFTELLSRMRNQNQNQNQNQNPLQQQQKQKQQKQQERMMMPVPVPVTVPLFGAPMAGASGGALAAAVARGGGLGSIAFPLKGEQKIPTSDDPCGSIRRFAEQLDLFESQAPKGALLCIGFIEDQCIQRRGDTSLITDTIRKYEPSFVQIFAPASTELIKAIRSLGVNCKILAQVGCEREARRVIEARVDGVIAQGREAGGHGLHPEQGCGTLPLARRVVQLVKEDEEEEEKRPLVLAAGGIVDGAGAAASLVLGCDAAVLGTRLWATHQAMGNLEKKRDLVTASADDAVRTRTYDQINNKVQKETANGILWRYPYDTCGVIWKDDENATTNSNVPAWHEEAFAKLAVKEWSTEDCKSYVDRSFTLAGEGVGSISTLMDAEDVVKVISQGIAKEIRRVNNLLV